MSAHDEDLGIPRDDLETIVADVLTRWPSAGLAIAVVRDTGEVGFLTRGVAQLEPRVPVSEDTVFRIGSVTKTFTALAVMQLWEQGLVDLDEAVERYLRAFRLVPVRPGLGHVTLRHLLTHTAGIGYWPRPLDLLRPAVGSGVEATRPTGPLSRYYRRGLPVEVEPGTKWMYTNHGFAVLGQVVEDVTGESLAYYLRDHVFEPLGMLTTDLIPSERVRARLATGHVLRRDGLRPVPRHEIPTPGGGAIYSTPRDMARYAVALLGGRGSGAVVRPETLATMFRPHFQSDPRIPGMGLAFELSSEGGHRVVGKDGVVSGFLSLVALAPDDRIGVVVLSNTGGLDARGAPVPLGQALLRRLLNLPASPLHTDIAPRPEVWSELCGWYGLTPGPMTNSFMRLVMGAGVEVRVRGSQLVLQPITPIPALRNGMRLHPDDPADPYAFRVDMSEIGKPSMPVVFAGPGDHQPVERLCFGETVFRKRPDALNPRLLSASALGTVGLAAAAALLRGRA